MLGNEGMSPRGFATGTALAVLVSLGLGWLVANQLSGFLAIKFTDKELPAEPPAQADTVAVQPLPPLSGVVLPAGFDDDPLFDLARRTVAQAAASRVQSGPAITVVVLIQPTLVATPEAYTISAEGANVTVTASDRRGAAYGLFRLADQVAAGRDWTAAATGELVEPALADRFVDTGAVGVRPDPEAYRAQTDYHHVSGALGDVVLGGPPWIDEAGLSRFEADWRTFIDHAVAYGFNGVVVHGFLEYVNFDQVGDGHQIYGPDSPHRARNDAMKQQVGRIWKYADDLGLKVVFKSDMLALSAPLEAYLQRETGMDTNSEEFWAVYRAGIDEFFSEFEWADGFMIRIGEGGSIYNTRGGDYYSALKVTDAESVRAMLRTFSEVAADYDAKIYFRTWSVGVGDVGDMHTNPETYRRLFDGVDFDNLVVSTKFVMGDFDAFLPLNPTLRQGEQRRLVELQARREFEAFGSIPNDLGPAHQTALTTFRAKNEHIQGVWVWTQDGGPWRAGPMSLYLKEGFWQLADLNVYTAARLGWDPATDLGAATGDWVRRTLTTDPAAAAAVGEMLALSREAVLSGFYIRPYAERQVFALGLEPPPMMWIFKWDIVAGDSAALSAVYYTSRGRVDEAIADGERAVATAEKMRDLLAAADRDAFRDPITYDRLASSLDYEVDLFRTLQTYRMLFLRYYEWLDTGSVEAHDAWQAALPSYRDAAAAHEARWTGNLNLPPYNFFAAEAGVAHLERSALTRAGAGGVLVLSVLALLLVPGLRAGVFTPWRVRVAVPDPALGHRMLVLGVPLIAVVGSRLALSGGLSVWHPVTTLGSLGLTALLLRLVLAWLRPGADGFWLWGCLGGALLVRTAILSGAMAARGPGGYWYRFWVDESAREAYVTVAFAALCYTFVAVVVGLRAAYGFRLHQGLGAVLVVLGVPLAGLGGLLDAVGLEKALTTVNDELALLPLGLSRILGLTVHLGVPTALPKWLLVTGGAVAGLGALLTLGRRQRGTG